MKLEEQVCTLEQAKALRALGIEQIGLFCYLENSAGTMMLDYADVNFNAHQRDYEVSVHPEGFEASFKEQSISAFTVAELGVMMPIHCDSRKDGSWWVCDEGITGNCIEFHADTEAECRATMLIYLLENKLTTPEEVNQRLGQ